MRDFDECKSFVDHMCVEHAHLHHTVQVIESELHVPGERDSRRVHDALIQLRNTLVHHFEEEESGGCLEEAACHCPSLSRDVMDIEREHGGILRLLDQLVAWAIRGGDVCTNLDFSESFTRFTKSLRALEAAETRILERAFGTVVANGDGSQ